jgi:hypothetical protein
MASTPDGLAFLKCAFAAPDFEAESVAGVPDQFFGRTITKRHRYTNSWAQDATKDQYIMILPTPGVAFWWANGATNHFPDALTSWTPEYYGDSTTLFPVGNEAAICERFRTISNCFEMICTSNATQWSGSLTTWKFPVTLTADEDVGGTGGNAMSYTIRGLQSTGAVGPNNFCTPANMGMYTIATHSNPSWDFKPILTGLAAVPSTIGTHDYGQLNGRIIGFGDMEGMIVKISAGTTSFVFKAWSCVEYQVNSGNNIYDYTRSSPSFDPKALETYRIICSQIPIAVDYFHNEDFWQRVLKLYMQATGLGSFIPGPVGKISSGLNMVGQGAQSLFL